MDKSELREICEAANLALMANVTSVYCNVRKDGAIRNASSKPNPSHSHVVLSLPPPLDGRGKSILK